MQRPRQRPRDHHKPGQSPRPGRSHVGDRVHSPSGLQQLCRRRRLQALHRYWRIGLRCRRAALLRTVVSPRRDRGEDLVVHRRRLAFWGVSGGRSLTLACATLHHHGIPTHIQYMTGGLCICTVSDAGAGSAASSPTEYHSSSRQWPLGESCS
jgi:hypothetical protein